MKAVPKRSAQIPERVFRVLSVKTAANSPQRRRPGIGELTGICRQDLVCVTGGTGLLRRRPSDRITEDHCANSEGSASCARNEPPMRLRKA